MHWLKYECIPMQSASLNFAWLCYDKWKLIKFFEFFHPVGSMRSRIFIFYFNQLIREQIHLRWCYRLRISQEMENFNYEENIMSKFMRHTQRTRGTRNLNFKFFPSLSFASDANQRARIVSNIFLFLKLFNWFLPKWEFFIICWLIFGRWQDIMAL